MALSVREKWIAIGVGATFALYAVDQLAIVPYFTTRSELIANTNKETSKKNDVDLLLKRQTGLKPKWKEIIDAGLTSDESDAQLQALTVVLDWAHSSGVNLTETKIERTSDAPGLPFEIISFQMVGIGSTPSMARFLMSFETTKLPVRIVETKIEPQKEGTDDLKIQLTISTLCWKKPATPPPGDKPAASAAVSSAADQTGNSIWN
jgi:hypothetical protein